MKINGNPDGGGGASVWGQITGTIDNQIDLNDKFNDQDSSIKGWVEDKGYLTEHQDISEKADISYVDTQISGVRSDIPSLTGYATETWVENKGYLTEHQSLKTINQQSIVGSGDITIEGGGVGQSEGVDKGEIFNNYEGNFKNVASGSDSHAEGFRTKALSEWSHAEGLETEANGASGAYGQYGAQHVEGIRTKAYGPASHAEGYNTIVGNNVNYQGYHAEGRFNVSTFNFQHTVGIGYDSSTRKNGHTITYDGKHYIPNVGGYIGTETDVTNVDDVATVINRKLEESSLKTINSQSIVGSGNITIEGGNTDEIEDVVATGYGALRDEIISNYYTKEDVDEKAEKSDAIVAEAIYFLTQNL